jgi:REP element-mobilizing transposase RayT
MPQSHAQIWLHTVFSTKNRRDFFEQPEFREQMFRMLAHHVKEIGCVVAIVGGHVDHVHLVTSLSRTLPISKFVEVIKTETSKWAKDAEGGNPEFAWQAGYGVFSVSASNLPTVKQYVVDQEQHHAERSYQDEFRLLCVKHGIEIDERYVWD